MSTKPNQVVQILMKRDGMTQEEAQELFEKVRATVLSCVDEGDYTGAEDAIMDDLGLEMDYIHDFLW